MDTLYKTCHLCSGRKRVESLGGIQTMCTECAGTGRVKRSDYVVEHYIVCDECHAKKKVEQSQIESIKSDVMKSIDLDAQMNSVSEEKKIDKRTKAYKELIGAQ